MLSYRFKALILAALFLMPAPVSAARFPNSVEKTISVKGDTARQWATILGLGTDRFRRAKLPLHPMEAHARQLSLGQEKETPAENEIVYDPKKSSLTLSGNWLDAATGSQTDVPRFNFSSGFIREDLSNAGGWEPLLRKLGLPKPSKGDKKSGEIVVKESSGSFFARTPPVLEVRIYRLQSWTENPEGVWGYQMMIGVEEPAP